MTTAIITIILDPIHYEIDCHTCEEVVGSLKVGVHSGQVVQTRVGGKKLVVFCLSTPGRRPSKVEIFTGSITTIEVCVVSPHCIKDVGDFTNVSSCSLA